MSKVTEFRPGEKGTEEEFLHKHQKICSGHWKSCSSGDFVDLHYYCSQCNSLAIVARNNEQELIVGLLREPSTPANRY